MAGTREKIKLSVRLKNLQTSLSDFNSELSEWLENLDEQLDKLIEEIEIQEAFDIQLKLPFKENTQSR